MLHDLKIKAISYITPYKIKCQKCKFLNSVILFL